MHADCTPVEERFAEVPGGHVFVCTSSPRVCSTDSPLVLLHDSLGCVDFLARLPGTARPSLVSPTLWLLIAARAAQGLGAAVIAWPLRVVHPADRNYLHRDEVN